MLPYNKNLKNLARELRKNMTDAERQLWSKIRRKQLKNFQFYRQKNFGGYIVDFYCPAAKLIVEVDGGHYYEDKHFLEDNVRDNFLNELGFEVLRFSNRDIFENIDGVVQKIYDNLKIPLTPFKKGGTKNLCIESRLLFRFCIEVLYLYSEKRRFRMKRLALGVLSIILIAAFSFSAIASDPLQQSVQDQDARTRVLPFQLSAASW